MKYRILLLLLTANVLLPVPTSKELALKSRLVRYAKLPIDDVDSIYTWLKKWYKGQTRTDLENEQVVAGGVRMALGMLLALKFMLLKRYGWGSKPVTVQSGVDPALLEGADK